MIENGWERGEGEQRLRRMMRQRRLDGVLFFSRENIRYLCGFTGDDGVLLMTPGEKILFSDSRFAEQARGEIRESSFVTVRNTIDGLARFLLPRRFKRLGIEAQSIPLASYRRLREKVSRPSLLPLSDEIAALRARKGKWEIEKIRDAVRIAALGFEDCRRRIRVGVREKNLANYLEYRMKIRGGERVSFPTIIASGPRAALPHGEASQKKLGHQETVVFDFGVCCQGYHSDETTTIFLGPPSREQRKIYEIVRRAQEKAIRAIRPGVPFRRVDAVAREIIHRAGYGKFFGHGLGHGIGLAVHEAPSLSPRGRGNIEEGMVFSVEPGIYLPGWGGVRLEDLVWVREGRGEILTFLPKRLEDSIFH